MNRGLGDWAWACIVAIVLLGAAAAIVFLLHPGTGQGQIGWTAGLLPGSLVGAMLLGVVQDLMPHAQRAGYLAVTIVFSFLWYFLIAYVVVKISRTAAGAGKA